MGIPTGILVCGGHNPSSFIRRSQRICHEYKKTTGTWESFASMTTERNSFDMIFLNQAVWAIGGRPLWIGSEAETTLDKYDMNTNVWTKHNIPFEVSSHCLTKISDNRLILIGGSQNGNDVYSPKTWIFDTRTNTWTQGPRMRIGRQGHGCFSIYENGTTTKVVAMGGEKSLKYLSTAEILDVASMQWKDLPDLPVEAYGNKGIESVIGPYLGFSVGGRFYVGIEKRIIGLRKNQNGIYYWQEVNNQLTTGREFPAVVNAPDS